MKKTIISKSRLTLLKKVGQSWIALIALLVLLLMVVRGTPLWAATIREINQTVPIPTATKLPTPVPPATATPKPPSNSGGGGQQAQQPTSTPTQQTENGSRFTGTVKSATLNVRSGPGTGYLVIGVLKEGDKLEILEQNAKGDWWRVCCLSGTDVRGWVSANFITPDFDTAQAQQLLPVATNVPALPTPTATTAPAQEISTTVEDATNMVIELSFVASPVYPLPGSIVTMQFTVTNPTAIDGIDVELRDELPKGISIVEVSAAENALLQQDVTENLREVFSVLWPTLASGETVTATARLQIEPTVPLGTVLDNLFFAGGTNIPGSTAGISIGMPPASLPDFQ